MKLYIARHGEAVGPQVDPTRPLSEQGREDVRKVGAALASRGVRVARVRHSPKRRAVETARILAEILAPEVELEEDPTLEPEGDPRDQLPELETWTDDTLVVGHLPHVARFTALLVEGRDFEGPVSFYPGTVVCLARETGGSFRLEAIQAP